MKKLFALTGYYRHENDVGRGADRQSDMFGLSVQQKVGEITIEPGVLSIHGDTLLSTELGTDSRLFVTYTF